MAISFHQDPQIGYQQPEAYIGPEVEKRDRSVLGAAFRQENDVLNLMELMARPDFTPDSEFDYTERAKTSPLFQQFPDNFIGIQSDAEWTWLESNLQEELKDRAAIQAAGGAGIAAAMFAGILSPTVLLPAGSAATASRVSVAAARAGSWSVVGAGVQEGVLQLNQDFRTGTESAVGIASAGVIGGGLGAAVRWLDPLQLDRIAQSMATPEDMQAIRQLAPPSAYQGSGELERTLSVATLDDARQALNLGPDADLARIEAEADMQGFWRLNVDELEEEIRLRRTDDSVGAARNPEAEGLSATEFDDPGQLLGFESRLGRGFGMDWLGPVTRQSMAAIPAFRAMMSKLSTGGLYRTGNLNFQATAPGGDVESLIKGWHAGLAQAVDTQVSQFYNYYRSANRGSAFRAYFANADYKRFAEEVGKAAQMKAQGRRHHIPEVNEALTSYERDVFGPAIKEAIRLKLPGFEELQYETALKHAQFMVRKDLVRGDYQAVRQMIFENAMEQLQRNTDLLNDSKIRKVLGLDLMAENVEDYVAARAAKTVMSREEYAEAITRRVMESFSGEFRGHGIVSAMSDFGTPKMHPFIFLDPMRKWSNGRAFGEFLENDMEKVARSFNRRMAPDIELYRAFGVTDPRKREDSAGQFPFWSEAASQVEQMRARADALEGQEKVRANAAISQMVENFERDFDVVIGRMRHDWGMPADPNSVGHRLGRAVLNLNTVRLMGSVTIASVPDLARPILKYGFVNTFRYGILPMLKGFRQFRLDAKEGVYSGAALDVLMHGRSTAMFDLFDDTEYGNRLERGLQFMTNKIGSKYIGMFDHWNTGLKMFSAHIVAAKLSKDIADAADGAATKQQIAFLSAHGIDEPLADRMARVIRGKGGSEVAPGVFMPNTEDWGRVDGREPFDFQTQEWIEEARDPAVREELQDELELQRVFRGAVARAVDDTIITPGVERPNWVDGSTAGRLISQFRSFTLSSTFKVLQAGRQDAIIGNSPQVLLGSINALALGALSYYIWANTIGGNTKAQMQNELEAAISGDPEAIGRWADEAINRSGLLGVFSEAIKTAERIPALQDYVTFGDAPTARSPFVNPVAELLGPSISLANNLGRIAVTLDDPTSETFRKAKQVLPYQNVFWLRQQLDALNEHLMQQAGVAP